METYLLRRANDFYQTKAQETNDPYYWFYLADAQVKAGLINQARQSIDKALWFTNPFPIRQRLLEMKAKLNSDPTRGNNPNSPSIVSAKRGDIDGDGIMDHVFLTAHKTPDSPFLKNITLSIQNGKTNHLQQITFKNNAGYNPTLFLGDFTGNKLDDILVVIDTGGSGGAIYSYIFSNINGQVRQIFNSDTFNENFTYRVTYQDQYKAFVTNPKLSEKYVLDLTYKGMNYLNEIYNENGNLKAPIEGWVNPLSGLYPVDYDRDGTYELESYQRIAGRYNADSLGYVLNVLKWNGQVFIPERENVAIFGGKF